MKKIRVAINGFGRIGRAFYKLAKENEMVEIVAVNDLGDRETMEYLLKYDSVYGKSDYTLEGVDYLSERDPSKLPWKNMDIDVVIESTGLFTSTEKSQVHIDAGAKRVVVSAPIKDDNSPTILMGVNAEKLDTCKISSNASCTTNAVSPLVAILDEALGIEKALLNTVHAYTASQSLVDGPSKKHLREGRAAAMNIVPSSTGATVAVTKVATNLKDKFDGISLRVPVVAGSIVDITFISKMNTNTDEVNDILKKASTEDRWKGIFAVTEEELVSRDIIGSTYASIADLAFTRVVDGNLVKVLAWYDNEMGYTSTLLKHTLKAGENL